MSIKQVVFDFETYYDQEYSLRKMTPVEYILDPRFEVIGVSVKEDGGATFWLEPEEIPGYLAKLPDKIVAISHNALFDMCILAWAYGYIPFIMVDTLGMARAWLQRYLRSLALGSIAKYLGLGVKGDTVMKVQGMSRAAIKAAGLFEAYKAYCITDSDLCWGAYRWMVDDGFPVNEIAVMDTVLRACIKPAFTVNRVLLAEHLHQVLADKEALLQRTGLASRDALMSNDQFAAALQNFGIEPPRKTSPVTGKETWAFAKTDPEFLDLEEHEDPQIQALVAARLGIKSTIEETRTQRLINISNLTWPSNPVTKRFAHLPLLPMPLKYSGAHTHRLGGEWKLNMQNLPTRGNNKIRMALEAPPDHVVVAVDASQIEARGVSSFCLAIAMRDAFARGEDIYSIFASAIFGRQITKANKPERFVGKQGILGLGYGLGWLNFQKRVALDSLAQTGQEIILTDPDAIRVVNTYRQSYREVPAMWRTLEQMIQQMTYKDCNVALGPIVFMHEKIKLPNGLYLYYHNLRHENGGWRFDYAGKTKYIYGGKLLENIIQALARIIIMDAAVRVRKMFQIDLNLQVHDELVYIVHKSLGEVVKEAIIEQMSIRPSWDPDWPLAAEGDIALSYGGAK